MSKTRKQLINSIADSAALATEWRKVIAAGLDHTGAAQRAVDGLETDMLATAYGLVSGATTQASTR